MCSWLAPTASPSCCDVAAANPDEPHWFASGFILRVELAPGAGLAGGCLITVDPELGSEDIAKSRLALYTNCFNLLPR